MGLPFNYSELNERRLTSFVDYSRYFESDFYEGSKIVQVDAGGIYLPSGRLLICDPVLLGREEELCLPFEHKVKPGTYPVTLCIVRGNTVASGDQYAALRITFSEKKPVKWLLALRGDEDLSALTQDGDYFGFSVEDGFGCLMDEQGRSPFLSLYNTMSEENKDIIRDYINPKLKESHDRFPLYQRDEGDWFNSQLPGAAENMILLQTGFGDGVYPCYWGVDEDNMAVQFVADFFVLPTIGNL